MAGCSRAILRWARIAIPPLLLSLGFALFLWFGNAIFAETINSWLMQVFDFVLNFEFPSHTRILFWAVSGILLTLLLGSGSSSTLLVSIDRRLQGSPRLTKDTTVSLWRTRILLVAVNVIYIGADATDVAYLWMDAELPAGVTYSEYTHQGVYNLIASVLLVGLVLSMVFRQAQDITHSFSIKPLSYAWIAQNLFLVSGAALRLKIYVETYHISLLRLYVLCFLVLVAAGFVILTVKIARDRSFAWLIASNLMAVFVLFFVMQFMNTRAFVANYNFDAELQNPDGVVDLDLAYLVSLAGFPHFMAEVLETHGRS